MRRNTAPPIKRAIKNGAAAAYAAEHGAVDKTAAAGARGDVPHGARRQKPPPAPPKGGATQQARAPEIQGAYAGFPLPAFVDVGEAVFHDLGDVVVIEGILDLFALFGALDELCPPQHPQLVRDCRNAHA